jgi:hypothetical protein
MDHETTPLSSTQKCQKLSQMLNSWTPILKAAYDESHQQQIKA